jgi:hypothetical protein
MNRLPILCALLACCLLAGCGKGPIDLTIITPGYTSLADGGIRLNGDAVTLHARAVPDASIDANGNLEIAGKSIAVDNGARQQLQRYYRGVMTARADGLATGKAGRAMAGNAIKEVASGLANGRPDQVEAKLNAASEKVQHASGKICQDMQTIKQAQDSLAGQLSAFRPYASIVGPGDIKGCGED